MQNAIGNIIIYALGISLGFIISRRLYIWLKVKPVVNTNYKAVIAILNTIIIVVGFCVGFITVVILYTIFYLITHGGQF
jgi:hypothetical protein